MFTLQQAPTPFQFSKHVPGIDDTNTKRDEFDPLGEIERSRIHFIGSKKETAWFRFDLHNKIQQSYMVLQNC